MTTSSRSAERLHAEILAEARRKGDALIDRARQEAEVLLAGAAEEAGQARRELLDLAHEEAKRQRELLLAAVPLETGRRRAERMEALLESVRVQAGQLLLAGEGVDHHEALIALASDAIRHMDGVAFVVKIAGVKRTTLAETLAEEIMHHVGRPVRVTISIEAELPGEGVVIEDGEARRVWDNRLQKKLERLWPELRRQIAERAWLSQEEITR